MTEQRTPEAVLHVEFRRNPLNPCRPDVAFVVQPDDSTLPTLVALMPFERARSFAGELMIQFLALEQMGHKPRQGPRETLTARLCRWARQWTR